MLNYPKIDPVAFHIGPLAVNWYGLMYLIGFMSAWVFLRLRLRFSTFPRGFSPEELSDILFYGALGTIIGGRIGYMVFYAWSDLVESPLSLFAIWKGGMSFHGGLLGVAFALFFYGRKHRKAFLDMTDFIIPAVPLGLAAGRIGNFINGELWGRITDVPWAMIFPYGGPYPRHPSQLYEFFSEGIILFLILWIYSIKSRPRGAVSGLFLICYACFRFIVECWREPDVQKGFVAWGWLTQGQLLCLPMLIFGIILMVCAFKRCHK